MSNKQIKFNNLYEKFEREWSFHWFDYIKSNPDRFWHYGYLSMNPNLSWEIVKSNPDKPWNYRWMCSNPIITWDIIQNNNFKWDYYHLSSNPNITWDIVKNNLDKPWDFEVLSYNDNITIDIINNNKDFDWDYEMLSSNINITWDIVKSNKHIPWDYEELSANPNITLDIIMNNPNKPWDNEFMFVNPNSSMFRTNNDCVNDYWLDDYYYNYDYSKLSWEFIELNKDKKWDYNKLSIITMDKAKEDFIRNKYRNYFMKEIAEGIIRRVMNPKYLGNDNDQQVERLKILGFIDDDY